MVSFGKSDTAGYVVGLSAVAPSGCKPYRIKEIKDIIDDVPVLSEEMSGFARWISDYYFCSHGEALGLFFPSGSCKSGKRPLRRIEGKNSELVPFSHPFLPTFHQNKSLEKINQALDKNENKAFLLYGVTASGKTEVYLQAAAKARALGAAVIVLVPEIVLAHEIVRQFQSRFGDDVAIWHSKLGPARRREEWANIMEGRAHIVVGPRSAIFSPVRNLKLVIVDEEHDTSYKESLKSPRYHGRDLAIKRAAISNAVVILGSATPSLESYYSGSINRYELIELPNRINARRMPDVRIIDLKDMPKESFFSDELINAIKERLIKKEQTILFINRRGFSYFILCRACGHVFKCRNCRVSLTYHRKDNAGICHYCGYREKVASACPLCKNEALRFIGVGTEKIEEEVQRIFPEARVKRLDSDVTKKRGAIAKLLEDLRKRRIDILVGTQMAAKGLDFPYVTLIGVILADSTLNVPDFRAGERTFQLLTQVTGRSGRGSRPGNCIIQTYNPNHYSITSSAKQDYLDFYRKEIEFRHQLNYPPFCHFIRVIMRGSAEAKVREAAERVKKSVEENVYSRSRASEDTFLIGPSPAPLSRLKGKYRWQFCVKTKNFEAAKRAIIEAVDRSLPNLKYLDVIIDPDPLDMF